jgi:hypothetical protein
MDPRYATGWCRHGIKDRDPVRVPLVQGDRADGLIAERRFRAAVRRAQRKRLMHHDLSPAEAAALARYEAGSGA